MNFYFYTIEIDGKKYRAVSNHYNFKKAAKQLGITREQIICRGADAKLPAYKKENLS